MSSFDERMKNDILVFDIGGGSTEFTLGDKNGIKKSISLNIGSVRITEKFFLKDGVYDYSYENQDKAVYWVLENLKVLEDFKQGKFILIGVAGTTTTQVSVKNKMKIYDSEEVHLSRLTYNDIVDNLNLYLQNIINQKNIVGLDPKRRDVIIGGTIILRTILEYFAEDELIVSENDNLMGAVLGGIDEYRSNK